MEDFIHTTNAYRAIFENTSCAMVILDEDTTISLMNYEFEHLSGYRRDEVEGKMSWRQFVAAEEIEWMQPLHELRRKSPSSAPRRYEFRFRDRAGALKDILLTIDIIEGTTKSVASLLDITELKHAERALRSSQEKYHDIFLNVSDLLFIHDLKGNFIETNLASKKSTGYTDTDLINMNLKDILPDRFKSRFKDFINRLLENGYDEGLMTIIAKTGEERILEYRSSLVLDPEGNPSRVRGSAHDITSRIRASRQLKKERDLITSIIQTSPAFYDAVDSRGKVIFMNQAMLNALNYSLSEVVGKDYLELFIPEEDRMECKDAMDRMVSSKGPVVHENRVLTKAGSTLLVQWQGKAMFRDSGEVDFVFGIGIDISQQRHAQELVLSSEKKFETVFQSSPVPSAITDIETGMIINANPALESLAGLTLEEALGKTSLDIGIWNNPADRDRIIRTVASGNTVDNEEVEYRVKTGEIRNILYSGRLIDINGKPHVLSNAQDITAHKRAEEALKESEERYRILAENARDVIWILDLDLKYVYMSPSVKRLRGYSAEEAMNQNLDQILTPESYRSAMEIFHKELGLEREGKIHGPDWSQTIEIEMYRKDGSTVWVEVIINLLYDKAGTLTSCMGITRDITKRKRIEEDLRESEEKFRLLFEKSGDATLILDEGHYIDCNEAALRMSGYADKSQLLSLRPADASPQFQPDGALSAEKAERMMELAIDKGSHQFEWVRKRFDGTDVYLEVVLTAIPIKGKRLLYTTWRDISERKLSENLMRARLRLMEIASAHPLDELLQATVDELEILTKSHIGFYHFLEAEHEASSFHVWSTNTLTGLCPATGESYLYPFAEAGIWKDCIHTRGPVIHNDYAATPDHKRLPEGHPELIRELAVPVIRGDRILAVLGVGNKQQDYTHDDVETASRFADLAWDIIEQKRMDQALRESEEKYRAIFENANEGILQTTPDGRLLNVNPSLARMFGFSSPKEMIQEVKDIGRDLYVNSHDRDRLIWILREKGSVEGFEIEMRRKDKSISWVSLNIHTVRDAAGNIAYLEGTNVDITERKRTEEALRSSEEKFSRAFQTSPALMAINTFEEGRYIDVNEEFLSTLGYTKEEVIGKTPDEIGIFPDRTYLTAARKIFEEQGMLKNYELLVRTKDGRLRSGLFSGDIIRLQEKEYWLTVMTDITEKKQTEEALKQSEERFRMMAEASPEIFWMATPDWEKVTYVSPALERISGITPNEMYQDPRVWLNLVHPEDKGNISSTIGFGQEHAEDAEYDFRIIRKDGAVRWIHTRRYAVRGAQGNLICFTGISEDITERKLSEEERRIYEARLMRSQKLEAIGTLAGGIAHDFNNILSAIIGYSELAIDELPPDSTASTSIKEVLKAGDRAKDLVKQILTFSRQMETEKKPVKVHLIIKEALKLLRSSIPSTITITESIDISAGRVFADSTQIHQVIMNLCTNAYQALLPTGGDLIVSLEQIYLDSGFISKHPPLSEGAHLLITVRDTGSGMDTETLKRIFDPFFTTKEKAKGTGLGLATVHGIVTELGGVILVESWVGKGSTFKIYLPVSQQEQEDMNDLEEEPCPGTGESILLVDDEEVIINFTRSILNQLGYKVKGICSSIDALNYFRSAPDEIDLVITDQTMPGITGSQLAAEILKIRRNIPIILMTGYSETITPEEAVSQGIKEYLDKPFTKNMLAGAIGRSLKS